MKLIKLVLFLIIYPIQFVSAQSTLPSQVSVRIQAIMEKENIPGAGVALISPDSISGIGVFGFADLSNDIAVTKKTRFGIGSASKSFLSVAAILAEEQGLLSLESSLTDLAPELVFTNSWSSSHPVRLIHLLEHTSGFDEAHFDIFPKANSSTTLKNVLDLSKSSLETRWKPGNFSEYNTLGFILAAYLIDENVDGSFEHFIKDNLFSPLNFESATYHPDKKNLALTSNGYAGTLPEVVIFPDLPQWPAGSLTLTTKEYASFVQMLLNRGKFDEAQILNPTAVKRLETAETSLMAKAQIQPEYAKGLQTFFEKGHRFFGHTGRYGGFLSEFGYSPELGFGYVIQINNVDGKEAIEDIKKVLLSTIEEKVIASSNSTDVAEFSKLTGAYQPITSVPQLGELGYFIYRLIDIPIIKEQNGKLYQSSIVGGLTQLIHTENHNFRYQNESLATSGFVQNENGTQLLLNQSGSYAQIPMWWAYFQFYLAIASLLVVLFGFLCLIIWIPIRLYKKSTEHIRFQSLTLSATCCFLGMVLSLLLGYNPEELYSIGSLLFYMFSWLFLGFSLLSIGLLIQILRSKAKLNKLVFVQSAFVSIACIIISSYMMYWGIIGLTLWNY